ncbi:MULTISPECIES: GntR family transcriptional regulator [Shouchella]|uniref:GntR family transcriptional regulator n=1 Tax=Shouchella TaxID=2893057 RepID=UPI00092287D9|nr:MULTISPECIES: GntR family transcriptional regulator [Shouchella]MBX0319700.1 GntR family transcriptional regulator [Shouchella clausii]MCM3381886.1 GntR family transcriptional regulator [Shouchella rhizosphaerae]MDO7268110.1 GntR family transcriptional regulator [Shouchella clausii]MDO7287990.1 GntR family transcriptional regulator [Shouchella clausii]PAD19573.1 GntR family transcriptional regulator [Shouchella clausii]
MAIHSPLYKQVAEKIKKDIFALKLKKDEAIPSENKLVEKYQVSRVTIRQAIKLLVEEGILYSIRGSGTYVKTGKIEQDIYRLQGFTEEMIYLNKQPANEILDFSMQEPTGKVRETLQLEDGEKVFFIRRLRLADGEPLILEETYMPVTLFPDLSVEVMTRSKYAYVEKKGYRIKERQGEIFPLLPDEQLKQTLKLEEGELVLFMDLWAYFENDTIFEYTKLYFRSEKYTFKFTSKRI